MDLQNFLTVDYRWYMISHNLIYKISYIIENKFDKYKKRGAKDWI